MQEPVTPVADARAPDLQAEREVRRLLAPILKADDEFDMLALGRIAQDKKCHRPLSPQDSAIWDWFASNDGGHCLASAARQYGDHRLEQVRQNGGTIVTTTTCNGLTTTTHHTYPPRPVSSSAPRARARSCSRTARPRERRAAASSSSSSQDPGDGSSDPPPPAPVVPTLAPPPRAIYSYGFAPEGSR